MNRYINYICVCDAPPFYPFQNTIENACRVSSRRKHAVWFMMLISIFMNSLFIQCCLCFDLYKHPIQPLLSWPLYKHHFDHDTNFLRLLSVVTPLLLPPVINTLCSEFVTFFPSAQKLKYDMTSKCRKKPPEKPGISCNTAYKKPEVFTKSV